MTPSDFAKRIQNYHGEVISAWREDQRVKAIKIVIQVSNAVKLHSILNFFSTSPMSIE